MNDMFTFEQTPWEAKLQGLRAGQSFSALRFLTLLEGEDEAEVELAFQDICQKHISLDVSALPAEPGSGAVGARLELEQRLAAEGTLLDKLDRDDPLRIYLEEVAGTPAAGDLELLIRHYAAGEESAAEMLVNLSLSRVIELAVEHTGRGVLLLDLIQEGSLALWESVLSWQGGDFEAHRDWYIRQAMAKAVTLQARSGGVGRKMRRMLEDYRSADRLLLTKLGRNPTLEEIALELNISPEDAFVVEQMLQNARTLEKAKAQPEEDDPEEEQAVEDTAYFQSRQRIMEMLSGLEEMDASILSLRFGLEGGLPLSPEDTGKRLGLTAQEVVEREAAALGKLRSEG